MSKQVTWTKAILEAFLEESGINDRIQMGDEKAKIYERIMRTRFAGWNQTQQAMTFNVSKDTIAKYVRELKDLYDETQKYSIILPIRKKDKAELDK